MIPDTQRAAHASISPNKAALHAIVIDTLRAFPEGLTSEEITELSGESYSNIQPRTSELRIASQIEDTGHRRLAKSGKSIIVWALN